ncbi:DUF6555 family protein [Pseudomonas sp. dw_358]|uniref:DUF6555 family protein n=1 Tax=Pseudomonas sp. dw_358 TaxID=2720083 RepID=UPI001BD31B32|nr:DUF6555 family protein [Pseudomonas sp. dw_358]
MPSTQLYVIDYSLHGQAKSFVIRADRMDNAEAWHWASCDAGVGRIGRNTREKIKKTSRPWAERFGITEVSWRAASTVPLEHS